MSNDQLFRLILLIGLVLFMPIGVYHRLKAHTGENLDRRQEGLFILITLRLAGLTGMAGFIAYLIHPPSMAWAAVPLPLWLRWTGVGLGFLASVLLVWMFRTLGKNLTDTVVTRKQHALVTTGPYRWVRHPLYSSAALAITGNSLTMANWFLFAAGGLMLVLLVIRTRKEEDNLIARFGNDYRDYMKRTGRFMPRWARVRD
jgi:protein-S-isoprenylcysteine O-methyltransferase Ste14